MMNQCAKYYLGFFFVFCELMTAFSQTRYLTYQNLNWDYTNDRLDIMEKSAQNGFNSVELSVHWTNIYPKSNAPANWGQVDRQIEKALSLNMKIGLRIIVSRHWQDIDGYWKIEEGSMRDNKGNHQREYWNTTSFSYTHRPAIDKAKVFITEVLERYKKHQLNGNILFITVVNQPSQELGYHTSNDYAEGDKLIGIYPTLFDYNKQNEDFFRNWLEKKYKKIEWYNYWNGTSLSSFSKAAPVSNRQDVNFTFYGLQGKDWYTYRHITLKNFIDEVAQTIKKVHPTYKYINSFGSVCDKTSNIRGTLAFKDLCENTDGIKINDALNYDHKYTMDVVRGNLPNKLLMNEIFPYAAVDKNDPDHVNKLEKQLTENYDHGATVITAVIEDINQFNTLATMFKRIAAKYINTPIVPIKAVSFSKYYLSKAIDFNHYDDYIYKEWKKEQDKFPNQIVDILIEEDLLKDSKEFVPDIKYIENNPIENPNNGGGGSSSPNISPIVRHDFSVQEIVMNRDFIFLIPSDIFYDPDGYMTRIVFTNKPSWLNVINGQVLQGKTPPDTGLYKIKIVGYDNKGASAQAEYIIKVVAPNISFRMIQANYFENLDKIVTVAHLKNNLRLDNWSTDHLYNIIATCNIDSVRMKITLSGAYYHNRKSDYYPHSLLSEGDGFNPPLGDYLIYAEAYYKDKLVAKNQVNFSFYSSAEPAAEWQVFPNPCTGILNIKLPKNLKPEEANFQIITESGQVISKTFKNIQSDKIFESIDLQVFPAGKYFLKINTLEKTTSIPFLKL